MDEMKAPTMAERSQAESNERLAGPGRQVDAAGVLALTEPGPAAAGVVVTDRRGRVLARRAHYLGRATRSEANAQALLAAMRLAIGSGMEAPTFRIDDAALVAALGGAGTPDGAGALMATLREVAAELPGHRIELVSPASNLARAVALEPLVDWLPERTRRAEELRVRGVGAHEFEVESESQPGQVYRVVLRGGDGVQCECADFQYRGIPCKHLLAVAREAGALERLFYSERPESAVAGASSTR
jgi:SWIM zinc finger/reverse transcriptase-like protein